MKNILIIGYGRVGSHLYHALKNSGQRYNIKIHRSSHSLISSQLINEAGIIFFCTQDSRIKIAAENILSADADLKGKIAVHTSGALSSGELSSLKRKGVFTASFHPVQTFNRRTRTNKGLFKNIYIAIEGHKQAAAVLAGIARTIGSLPFRIETRYKTLHHICCVISSNYLVTHLSLIDAIYRQKFGFKKDKFFNIYMPLIRQTLSNISGSGIISSLTGPIERNDTKTIKKHLEALETLKGKEIVDYYRFVGLKTLKIAEQKESISKHQSRELTKLFKAKN